jgi:hypothetical protein
MKRGAGRWVEIRLSVIMGLVPRFYKTDVIDYQIIRLTETELIKQILYCSVYQRI